MAKLPLALRVNALLFALLVFGVAEARADQDPITETLAAQLKSDIRAQGHVGLARRDVRVPGEVILTFDDGPHVYHTPRVLDLLEHHRLHATFFLVGVNINRYSYPIVQRMRRAGHTIGSHSYDHDVQMADGRFGGQTVSYIRGQHEATQILVELALLASTADEFDRLYRQVFATNPGQRLSTQSMILDWPRWVSRHRELLDFLGYSAKARPYAISIARPPGGGPYYGSHSPLARQRHDEALGSLGWLTILWHDGCWDPDPARMKDFDFIANSLSSQFFRGGVVVIHDYVRYDALTKAFAQLASDRRIKVVALEDAVVTKYGISLQRLAFTLSQPAPTTGNRLAQNPSLENSSGI